MKAQKMTATELYDALTTQSGVLQDRQIEAEGNAPLTDMLQQRIEDLDNAASAVDEAITLHDKEARLIEADE